MKKPPLTNAERQERYKARIREKGHVTRIMHTDLAQLISELCGGQYNAEATRDVALLLRRKLGASE